MKRPLVVLAAVVAALALLIVGYLRGRRRTTAAPAPTHSSVTAPDTGGKVLYWYDPMLPEQYFDQPGLSPMGMEMVPRYADAGGHVRLHWADGLGHRRILADKGVVERAVAFVAGNHEPSLLH